MPSVPGSGRAVKEPSGRSQSWDLPSMTALNTRLRPSGEIAGPKVAAFSGTAMVKRMTATLSVGARRKYRNARTIAAMSSTAVDAIHATRSRVRGRNTGAAAIVTVWPELVAAPERFSIANARSRAE